MILDKSSPMQSRPSLGERGAIRAIIYFAIILLMMNLNALVDYFIHPEIPYFDREHIMVGGVTGIVSAVLFGLLFIYTLHLNRALNEITNLERFLHICSYCKKIRRPEADPNQTASWQPLENYLLSDESNKLSHGICPACMTRNFPEFLNEKSPGDDKPIIQKS